ncbi:MAG: hypothetical protein NW226_10930 [Microscillaceae bacterium]|nr:hypothetical protein [Microscillaceae bacterium]
MNFKFWNTDKVVSVSAILISVMSLVVLVYQTQLMQAQQRLSVLPYLSLINYNTGGPDYKIVLSNDGVGPAFIEDFIIRNKKKEYHEDIANFLRGRIKEADSLNNFFTSNISIGKLVAAGEKINLVEIKNSKEDGIKLLKIFQRLGQEGFDLEIIYSNVYNEKWSLNTASPQYPKPSKIW